MPRYLVTGADGFIGSHLVRRLMRRGHVAAIVRPGTRLSRLRGVERDVEVCLVDVCDAEALGRVVSAQQPDAVFHLAAAGITRGASATDVTATNVIGTQNMLAALAPVSTVRSAVFAGSWYEYGRAIAPGSDRFPRPTTPYGISKFASTLLVQDAAARGEVPALVVRPFQVYGPREAAHRLIPQVVKCAREGAPLRLKNGGALRDWVYVEDVVAALERAAAADLRGQVIDVGTGIVTAVRAVASRVLELMQAATPIEPERESADAGDGDASLSGAADTVRAHELLGWTAEHDLSTGLRESVEWCLAHDEVAALTDDCP